jgi:hypothetical protein
MNDWNPLPTTSITGAQNFNGTRGFFTSSGPCTTNPPESASSAICQELGS